MPNTNVMQPSFAAGEISPTLYARVDLAKYKSGLAKARNWFVDYRGGASSRPGSLFVGTAGAALGQQPRLVPFVVSATDSYVLVFGNGYILFVRNGAFVMSGGVPYRITTPFPWYVLPSIKYSQSANVLTITIQDYAGNEFPPYELRRTGVGPDVFTLTPKASGPSITPPVNVAALPRNNTAHLYTYAYIVTSVGADGSESDSQTPVPVDCDILDQNTGKVVFIQWTGQADAASYRVYKSGPVPSGQGNEGSAPSLLFGFIGETQGTSFTDNNIGQDYSQTPPVHADPFAPGQLASVNVVNGGSGFAGLDFVPLFFNGDGTGAAGYGVVDRLSQSITAVVMLDFGRGYTFCAVSDTFNGSSTYAVTFGQQTGTFPATSGYFKGRQVFGGTANFPNALVFSRPGAYSNFNTNLISEDDDAITANLNSLQLNAIKSVVSMNTGLVVLTSSGGWLVSGGSPEAPFTPSSISALPQSCNGANDLPPIVVNYDILYGQNRGSVVRDLAFNFYVQSYTGTDRSVLASHLFTNYKLTEWTYAEEPFRMIHVIRSDGRKLNFTYVPEQEIYAWTTSDTDGMYRSVASIPEGDINAVYHIVEREIAGVWNYYLEREADRNFHRLADAWCLDCALALPSIQPAATLNLSGTTGTLTATADADVFSGGSVGQTIWAGNRTIWPNLGRANITAYIDPRTVTVEVVQDFEPRPNSALGTPWPFVAGSWELLPNVTTVSGLDHLEGATVTALADGIPRIGLVVFAGTIHLPIPASKVIVGLPYDCQLQTLRLDSGDGTTQGKRKVITGLNVIVDDTVGLEAGRDFNNLRPVKELIGSTPPVTFSTVVNQGIAGMWTVDGQIAFQQSLPYPASILGVVLKVVLGDVSNG